jgi:CMP-N,N'-diacetyllegionaminic acid synthase
LNLTQDTLVVIPARGGSKGIPGKNIKPLGGKPLIHYSIETARKLFDDRSICISTDSQEIKDVAQVSGISIPFTRPVELATDNAGTYEVLLHAVNFFENQGMRYSNLLLLQPTSPFRDVKDISKMMVLFKEKSDVEMVVSVGVSHHNPYFSLFEENGEGYLVKSKTGIFNTRQECPKAYFYNGSAYLLRISALKERPLSQFTQVVKYVMEEKYCIDIDTPLDWLVCEALLEKGIYTDANN